MKFYDISIPLSPRTPTFPGDTGVSVDPFHRLSWGDGYDSSQLTLSTHSGTHIDPPAHLLPEGATIDQLPLDALMGKAWVAQIASPVSISAVDLAAAGIPAGTERLLLKTRNSDLWERPGFQSDFVHLEPGGATWIANAGIRLVGVDYLTLDRLDAPTPETHLILLQRGIIIVEGLDLRPVAPGPYTLACLPLRIERGDGAPARAVLFRE
ncbi:MAG: cyclase family protein [Chloroflexi bacterium]|nr:cyclase family protein [Chloroflexota bacterium]